MKNRCAILLFGIGLLAQAVLADQQDPRLDDLFQKLKQAENAAQAYPIENSIWNIWMENDDAQYQNLMRTGIAQMNSNNLRTALATFTQLINQAPDYAEAWNKRATIYYLLGDFKLSELDINETLKREPLHFGALSGLGLVCLEQKEYFRARNAFNAALEVYPAMDSVRNNLDALQRMLRDAAI